VVPRSGAIEKCPHANGVGVRYVRPYSTLSDWNAIEKLLPGRPKLRVDGQPVTLESSGLLPKPQNRRILSTRIHLSINNHS